MLLITVLDQYPSYYKALEMYTGYFNSLDIMIFLSYPSSIVTTRDYCTLYSMGEGGGMLFQSHRVWDTPGYMVHLDFCILYA